ncbi:MAG: family hydrolase, partial [Acidimicrobiales bacterium]|nr:family hydrolase [Acidimicrobiales bacterium]
MIDLVGPLRPLRRLSERHRRHTWRSDGRAHIEVRGVHRPDDAGRALAAETEAALRDVEGVRSAAVNGVTGRVVVAHDEDTPFEELVGTVEDVERRHGVFDEPLRVAPDHPADTEPIWREVGALAVDGASLGVAVAGRVLRLARLPVETAAMVSLAQAEPHVRRAATQILGPTSAHVALATINAVTHGFAQGPVGLVVDATVRASIVAEHLARRSLWHRVEATLNAGGGSVAAVDAPARPVPLPEGPIEQYAKSATIAGFGGFAVTAVATADVRRGLTALVAASPKAAVQGREVFAAHVDRFLAARGVLSMDPGALRRLDRVDCLVLDGALAAATAHPGRIVLLDGAADHDLAEVHEAVRALFDPQRPRQRGPWQLRPLPQSSPLRRRLDVRRAVRDQHEPLLVLRRAGHPVAVVTVDERLDPHLVAMVDAAHDAGWMTAALGDDVLVAALGADLRLDDDALSSVRMLQEDGCVVALVSPDATALAAADVAVGLLPDGAVPWSADVICPAPADALRLIEIGAVAHEVSRQSAAFALAGSSVAVVLGLSTPRPEGARRAHLAVNVASLAAQANGLRVAWTLARLPPTVSIPPPPWHELDGAAVLALVGSSPKGLTRRDALARRPAEVAAALSLPAAMVEELANPLTPVLAGAAAVAGAVGSATDAAIVGSVTLVNAVIGGVQRWRVDRSVRALEESSGQRVRVRREGQLVVVSVDDLAVGDLLTLASGDSVPADARLLATDGLEVDESSLTGESIPVTKSIEPVQHPLIAERTSMLYDGTVIAVGDAEAVVVAVGAGTEAGAAAAAAGSHASSGVEARLASLTRRAVPADARLLATDG